MAEESSSGKRKPRVHKTTLLIVLLFVFVPWVLVAIPGDAKKSDFVEFRKGRPFLLKMQHGWPAIHMTSAKNYDVSIDYEKKVWRRGTKMLPASIEKPISMFNWGIDQQEQSSIQFASESFWSDLNRWPSKYFHTLGSSKPVKFSMRFVWQGMLFNTFFLLGCCYLFGWTIERRIRRRGSIFLFTIFETLLFVLLICAMFAWIHRCNRAEHLKQINEQKLNELDYLLAGYTKSQYRQAIPRIVARLLDYPETLPFLKREALWPIHELFVVVNFDSKDGDAEESATKFASELNNLPYPKSLHFSRNGYLSVFLAKIENRSVSEISVFIDQSQLRLLKSITPFADRAYVELRETLYPNDALDLSAVDEIPDLRYFAVNLSFGNYTEKNALEDWQNAHVDHVLRSRQLDGALFEQLNEPAAKHLLKVSPGDRVIAFSGIPGTATSYPSGNRNKKLVSQLIEAGFSDDIDNVLDEWSKRAK